MAGLCLTLAALAATVAGCEDGKKKGGLTAIQVGGRTVQLEIVASRAARETGLMHRRALPEDQGMLFVYPEPRKLGFYMRNTLIPLSIAYVAEDGTIQDIHPMKPLDETTVPSGGEAKFALEVNQGWFERNGVKAGDRLELPEAVRTMQAER